MACLGLVTLCRQSSSSFSTEIPHLANEQLFMPRQANDNDECTNNKTDEKEARF